MVRGSVLYTYTSIEKKGINKEVNAEPTQHILPPTPPLLTKLEILLCCFLLIMEEFTERSGKERSDATRLLEKTEKRT